MQSQFKIDIVLFAALLTSGCDNPGALGAISPDAQLTGTIEGWTEGSGYKLAATIVTFPVSTVPLSTGTVDATGRFTISLPTQEAVTPRLADAPQLGGGFGNCSARPEIKPMELKTAYLFLTAQKSGAADISIVLTNVQKGNNPTRSDTGVTFLYADRSGSITGKSSCDTGGDTTSIEYALNLQEGWNSVLASYQSTSLPPTQASGTKLATGLIPTDVKWRKM